MPLVVPIVGEMALLNMMLIAALNVDEGFTLKLFQNNVSPDSFFTASSFTEATFTDYTAKAMTRSGWGAPALSGGKAVSTYQTTFSWTGGAISNTIYGYYIVGATSGTLLWCEKFAASRFMGDGDILNVQPIFSLKSEV